MMQTAKKHHMRLFAQTSAFLLALVLFLQTTQILAADTLVEIFFLPHRPALVEVSNVENVVAEFNNIVINKYDFEDPAAKKYLEKYSLSGHTPLAIFINGQNTFTVKGKKISLRNFNKGNAFVPMFAGEWDYDDLRIILREISGEK